VLYNDASTITPLLPCTPVAFSTQTEVFWLFKFDVMGPREERRSNCGGGERVLGPVLCLIGG
jgi:hypothetical protein